MNLVGLGPAAICANNSRVVGAARYTAETHLRERELGRTITTRATNASG